MSLEELILELLKIKEAHPRAAEATVQSRTLLGKKSNHVAVRLRHEDHLVLIEGYNNND
jgi:hypothetical protein